MPFILNSAQRLCFSFAKYVFWIRAIKLMMSNIFLEPGVTFSPQQEAMLISYLHRHTSSNLKLLIASYVKVEINVTSEMEEEGKFTPNLHGQDGRWAG